MEFDMNRYIVRVAGEFKACIEKDNKNGNPFHLMKDEAILYLRSQVEKMNKKIAVLQNLEDMPADELSLFNLP